MTDRPKAIGMYSGGLDSILAAKIIKEEGFEVVALHFYTGFNELVRREILHGPSWKWEPDESVVNGAEKLGIELVAKDVTEEYIDVMLNPGYGYGSGVNPCIDCRIFNLRKAKEFMESAGAAFVFTGEVLGQRPMSQHRNALDLIARKSGLEGLLLRPLSAKLLEPTVPECESIIKRGHLHGISGRSRKPQQELAVRYGIDWYPNSGPGCILTDKRFALKFSDLVEHRKGCKIGRRDLSSLKTGRHLRLESGVKIIIGRTREENEYLEQLLRDTCWIFDARDFPGASVFAFDEPQEDDFSVIASLCARYGKGKGEDAVTVIASKGAETKELVVKPAFQYNIEPYFLK